jgi:putative membrane protein
MNTTLTDPTKIKNAKLAIIAASIAVPLVVVVLFGVKIENVDLTFLPPIYATINGMTAIVLLAAVWAIRSGKRELHRSLIRIALLFSLLFLVGYVAYHMTSDPTIYGDSDGNKELSLSELEAVSGSSVYYYVLLVSHILFSVFIIPLVLFSYFYAWTGNYAKHKKWTKIAFPMWLYVAVTGVVVYWMIAPYYG